MSSTVVSSNKQSYGRRVLAGITKIGKVLIIPISVMPLAAILLRVGAQIPATTEFSAFVQAVVQGGGNVVFDNLHILFAVGVGFGLAKDNRGEAALASLIGMLLLMSLLSSGGGDLVGKIYGKIEFSNAFDPETYGSHGFVALFGNRFDAIIANNVLNGIIAGSIVAFLYNKFSGADLPVTLSFFGGRRLPVVLAITSIMIFSILWAVIFPWIGYIIFVISDGLADATGNHYANAGIMSGYGILNRILLPFGLHHIPNTLFWFQLGSHVDAAGNVVVGDIFIFLNGVAEGNTAGTFQSGFFPVMMFGLPAAVLAFRNTAANDKQAKLVVSMLGGSAIVSFLTGITEPIEYSFLFVAPALFGFHAILTGLFGLITGLFGIQLGFGFSAGLFDYILSIPKSMEIIRANKTGFEAVMANPAWLLVIGAGASATYYYGFKFAILKWNLDTPGRGKGIIEDPADVQVAEKSTSDKVGGASSSFVSSKATAIVEAFGGHENITGYANCATRLRYDVKDASLVDEDAIKRAGAIAVKKVGENHFQAIIGTEAESLNMEIEKSK